MSSSSQVMSMYVYHTVHGGAHGDGRLREPSVAVASIQDHTNFFVVDRTVLPRLHTSKCVCIKSTWSATLVGPTAAHGGGGTAWSSHSNPGFPPLEPHALPFANSAAGEPVGRDEPWATGSAPASFFLARDVS